MNPLLLLSTSLGLGTLSGVNLYMATFMTGAAIRWDFLQLHDRLHGLETLANPWVLGVSGVMYGVELFADKIPGLDSVWDAIHTAIRPLGAMAMALSSLGSVSTELSVLAGLVAGTAGVTTHVAKMGTRLVANTSPEPFSNIALSTAEDVAVAAGWLLLMKHPYIAGGAALLILVGLWFLIPRIFRKIGGVVKALKNRFSRKPVEAVAL